MERYEEPNMKIVDVETDDVITTSGVPLCPVNHPSPCGMGDCAPRCDIVG